MSTEIICRYKRRISVIKFTWIIENFLSWCNTHPKIKSPVFPDHGDHQAKWQLHLHPKVYDDFQEETNMLLELHPVGGLRDDVEVKASFQMIPNDEMMVLRRHETREVFHSDKLSFYWIKRNQRSYYPDGHLRFQCIIEVGDFVCGNDF